jgi:ferredoxin-NADP reductase
MRQGIPVLWRVATVLELIEETPRAKTIVLDVPDWMGHMPGQHVDVRLTAEDGYQAQRSYSIASAPEAEHLELTVERLEDGEVSPYLVDELRPGDPLELRGPIGGLFAWTVDEGGPLLLLGGGSGLVPLMAMLRHRALRDSDVDARLLVSVRRIEELLYREELAATAATGAQVAITLTRERPAGWTGFDRRVDAALLDAAGFAPDGGDARVFVCGSTPFVLGATDALLALGHRPETIRTEQFGPTQ